MELEKKIIEKLTDAKKIAFLGIGEDKLRDDGVGPYVITQLIQNNSEKVKFINGRTTPEERMSDIQEFSPSHIVLIDTCTLNKPPGTVTILEKEDMFKYVPISSHTIPIPIFINILEERLEGVITFMIGIVPKSIDLSDPLIPYKENEIALDDYDEDPDLPYFEFKLTEEVQGAADSIVNMIKKLLEKLNI